MYNQERKNEYFNYVEKMHETVHSRKYIFSSLASIEEAWGKDICDFTLPEILMVLATFNASSKGALVKNLSILKTYTDWCCSNRLSLDNINHYKDVNTSELDRYVNKITSQIVTREELYAIMQQFLNKSDQFIALALFEGVRTFELGELMMLKISDIDEKTLTVTFPNNVKRNISKDLYVLALQSSNEEVYKTVGNDGEIFESVLNCDGHIINSRANSRLEDVKSYEKRLTNRLRKLRVAYQVPYLTVPKLKLSGVVAEFRKVMDKYGIDRDELFTTNFERYIRNVNPNYELAAEQKGPIKTRFYDYLS